MLTKLDSTLPFTTRLMSDIKDANSTEIKPIATTRRRGPSRTLWGAQMECRIGLMLIKIRSWTFMSLIRLDMGGLFIKIRIRKNMGSIYWFFRWIKNIWRQTKKTKRNITWINLMGWIIWLKFKELLFLLGLRIFWRFHLLFRSRFWYMRIKTQPHRLRPVKIMICRKLGLNQLQESRFTLKYSFKRIFRLKKIRFLWIARLPWFQSFLLTERRIGRKAALKKSLDKLKLLKN